MPASSVPLDQHSALVPAARRVRRTAGSSSLSDRAAERPASRLVMRDRYRGASAPTADRGNVRRRSPLPITVTIRSRELIKARGTDTGTWPTACGLLAARLRPGPRAMASTAIVAPGGPRGRMAHARTVADAEMIVVWVAAVVAVMATDAAVAAMGGRGRNATWAAAWPDAVWPDASGGDHRGGHGSRTRRRVSASRGAVVAALWPRAFQGFGGPGGGFHGPMMGAMGFRRRSPAGWREAPAASRRLGPSRSAARPAWPERLRSR